MHYRSIAAARTLLALAASAALGACADGPVAARQARLQVPESALQALECEVTVESGMHCTPASPATGEALGVQIGKQGTHVQLASSNAGYDSGTGIFSVDVTVQNLMNEAIGTPDGTTPDPAGIMVYFAVEPYASSGVGPVDVDNETGQAFFTAANQPYFRYDEVLAKNEVSSVMTWRFSKPAGVTAFRFTVYVEATVEYQLVINEVMVNSAGSTYDTSGDWFEVYNAGTLPVDLQDLVVADSAASGRRPYHRIASSVSVAPGGYAVLSNNADPGSNGGVTADYALGGAIALASSLDAVKIARVFGMDTLTLDRTQYASASTSAQDGISRELKNPALDNANMDGSNWGSASVTSVYGAGGRGTPRAQNSVFTP